jgi:hypothetical protein
VVVTFFVPVVCVPSERVTSVVLPLLMSRECVKDAEYTVMFTVVCTVAASAYISDAEFSTD